MAQQTIASLVAMVSADTTALEARLKKVEELLKGTQTSTTKATDAISNSFKKSAEGVKALGETAAQTQKGLANLAKFEYQQGITSAREYKVFLEDRLKSFKEYSTEWKSASSELASLQRKEDAEATKLQAKSDRERLANKKKTDADKLKAEKEFQLEFNKLLKEEEKANADSVKQINKAWEERQAEIKKTQTALSNQAKFEYETGQKSAQDYHLFLQEKMGYLDQFTSEWKATSLQLVAVEKDINSEIALEDKAFMDRRTAIFREGEATLLASKKEFAALGLESQKAGQLAQTAALDAYYASQASKVSLRAGVVGGVSKVAGGTAAGIFGVEALAAGEFASFETTTSRVANNAILTNAQLEKMRTETLALGKETGASFDQIALGYRTIISHGFGDQGQLHHVLKTATMEAVATGADVEVVANGLAGTMHVYHIKADEMAGGLDGATRAMGVLDRAAARAKTDLNEWILSTSQATATAAVYKISLQDVNAALTTLVQNRLNPHNADTQVKGLINSIANPKAQVRDLLKEIDNDPTNKTGISLTKDFTSAGLAAKDLYGVLLDIKRVTGGDPSTINKLIGAQRGSLAANILMNRDPEGYRKNLQINNDEFAGNGKTNPVVQGYTRTMDTFNQQLKVLVNTISVEFMPVGKQALNIFKEWLPTIKKASDFVLGLMQTFQKLPKPIQEVVTLFGAFTILNKYTGLLEGVGKTTLGAVKVFRVLKDVISGPASLNLSLGEGAAATTSFGARLGALAVSGGPIALVTLAIAGLAFEIYKLNGAYNDMAKDQEAAANGAKAFADARSVLATKGEAGALLANQNQIADNMSLWKTKVDALKAEKANNDSFSSKGLPVPGRQNSAIEKELKYAQQQYDLNKKNYDIEGARLSQLSKSGTDQKLIAFGAGTAGPIGVGIASKIDDLQLEMARGEVAYTHHCQELARVTVQKSTAIFDGLWGDTAYSTLQGMKRRGLVKHYYTSVALSPGDLLYSETLAMHQYNKKTRRYEDYGHVQEVGKGIGRYDQYGKNHFGLNNFQWVFNPDEAASIMGKSSSQSASKGGLPQFPPTTSRIGQAQIDALTEAAKEHKKELAAAEAAEKALQRRYHNEIIALNLIIALKKKSEDLDSFSNLDKAKADLAPGGAFSGVKDHASRQRLLDKAMQADVTEHKTYLANLVDRMNNNEKIASKPFLMQKAIEAIGGWDKWKAAATIGKVDPKTGLSTGQQTIYDTAKTNELNSAVRKAAEAMLDLRVAQKYAGNEVMTGAIQAAGGAKAWEALGDGTSKAQKALIELTRSSKAFTSIQQLQDQWSNEAASNADEIKTKAQAAEIAISSLAKKLGININDPAYKAKLDSIRYDARSVDNSVSDKFLNTQSRSLDVSISGYQAKQSGKLDTFDHTGNVEAKQALARWEKDNYDAVERIKQHGTLVQRFLLAQFEYRLLQETKDEAKQSYTDQGIEKMASLTQEIEKKGLALKSGDPFQQWLTSFYDLKQSVDKDGKTILGYALPDGMDVDNMKRIWDLQKKITDQAKVADIFQQGAQSIADGAMSGLDKAFNPSGAERGNLQTKLLSLQQEREQYMVAEAQFKNQYPNNPNDPYIDRLKKLQNEINKTNTQINKMGGGLVGAFNRFFGSIYDSFKQTMVKLAQEFLKSQLLQYLQKQIGTGSSYTGGGGSSSILGSIIGAIGGAIGGGPSSSSYPTSPATYDGSKFGPGFAEGAWNVPGPSGGGDIIPAMLSPGEMVIPVSSANKIRSGQTGANSINQRITVNISTPDVQSFRQSRASIAQDLKKAIRI